MIETIIKNNAALMTYPPDVYFGTMKEQNIEADKDESNRLFVREPITSIDTLLSSGVLSSAYNLQIEFLQSVETGLTSEDNASVVDQQRINAAEFIQLLWQYKDAYGDNVIRSITNINRVNRYELMDASMAGCLLTFQITILDETRKCL